MNEDYIALRREATDLYNHTGVHSISAHIGIGGSRATCIEEVADENLPRFIRDLKSLTDRMGLKK